MYELSLLPVISKQVEYFAHYNETLKQHIDGAYERFLTFVDAQSKAHEGKPSYDQLQMVYRFASDRRDQLSKVLKEEAEDIEMLGKLLEEIDKTQDEAQFSEIANELIESGDYKTDADAFKAWIEKESSELAGEVSELLEDWEAGIKEGSLNDLALLIEAIEEEEELSGGDDEDFSFLFQDDDGEGDDEEESEQEAPSRRGATKLEACCADKDFEQDGCCGKQTPCCKEDSSNE